MFKLFKYISYGFLLSFALINDALYATLLDETLLDGTPTNELSLSRTSSDSDQFSLTFPTMFIEHTIDVEKDEIKFCDKKISFEDIIRINFCSFLPVKNLNFTRVTLGYSSVLHISENYGHLFSGITFHSSLNDDKISALQEGLKDIVNLNLPYNALSNIGIRNLVKQGTLNAWSKVSHLNLDSNIFDHKGIEDLIKDFNNLQELSLSHMPLTDAMLNELSYHSWIKFNSLRLAETNLNLTNIYLLSLTKLNQVTTLDIGYNKLNDTHMQILFRAPLGWINLENLILRYNNISQEGVKNLATHAPLHLKKLDLEGNRIQDRGLHIIAHKFSEQLVELNVKDNIISDRGAIPFFDYTFPKLTTLHIAVNLMGKRGHKALEYALKYNKLPVLKKIEKDKKPTY